MSVTKEDADQKENTVEINQNSMEKWSDVTYDSRVWDQFVTCEGVNK